MRKDELCKALKLTAKSSPKKIEKKSPKSKKSSPTRCPSKMDKTVKVTLIYVHERYEKGAPPIEFTYNIASNDFEKFYEIVLGFFYAQIDDKDVLNQIREKYPETKKRIDDGANRLNTIFKHAYEFPNIMPRGELKYEIRG